MGHQGAVPCPTRDRRRHERSARCPGGTRPSACSVRQCAQAARLGLELVERTGSEIQDQLVLRTPRAVHGRERQPAQGTRRPGDQVGLLELAPDRVEERSAVGGPEHGARASVPGTGVNSSAARSRTQTREPPASVTTKARRVPSGEMASDCRPIGASKMLPVAARRRTARRAGQSGRMRSEPERPQCPNAGGERPASLQLRTRLAAGVARPSDGGRGRTEIVSSRSVLSRV